MAHWRADDGMLEIPPGTKGALGSGPGTNLKPPAADARMETGGPDGNRYGRILSTPPECVNPPNPVTGAPRERLGQACGAGLAPASTRSSWTARSAPSATSPIRASYM